MALSERAHPSGQLLSLTEFSGRSTAPKTHIPAAGGLPPGVKWVVDVVGEMPRAKGVVDDEHYLAFPMLDGSILPVDPFREAIRRVAGLDGEVLIHCAAGRGRSAALMAGVLLARMLADSPEQAVEILRAARPGIRINLVQMRVLEASAGAL